MYYDLCNGTTLCHEMQLGDGNGNGSLLPLNGTLMMGGNETEEWPMETTVRIVVPLFFGIIGLAGLLGNALVIIVVTSDQRMRSTTNLLIINLAVSDIMFVIFCVPFTATDYMMPTWPFGDLWCKVVQYMIVVTCHASVYTLVLMSFDRFLAVVHPVTSMSLRTERNATIAIWMTWLIITTTAIPVAISHGVINYPYGDHDYTTCMFQSNMGYNLRAFQVGFFLSSYMMPLTLICLLYIGMLTRLWKGPPGCKPSAESRRGKKRVTRMVTIVVLAFAICWLPIQLILVAKSFDKYANTPLNVTVQIISHTLAYTNSCINPVLYAFLSDNFRKAFRKFMRLGPPMSSLEHRGGGAGGARSHAQQSAAAAQKTTTTNITAAGTSAAGAAGAVGDRGNSSGGAEAKALAVGGSGNVNGTSSGSGTGGGTFVAVNVGERSSRPDIL